MSDDLFEGDLQRFERVSLENGRAVVGHHLGVALRVEQHRCDLGQRLIGEVAVGEIDVADLLLGWKVQTNHCGEDCRGIVFAGHDRDARPQQIREWVALVPR